MTCCFERHARCRSPEGSFTLMNEGNNRALELHKKKLDAVNASEAAVKLAFAEYVATY